ncbi:hypothetical protein EMIHUDRAFT_120156 [Emiliania huxleyi CCMP1516]|uniref:Bromo domain-containing protein n=2 Tax=Emiliania huxleyi TaxID=2903 RepID=A0A0D3ILY4_EMIH1|nr:hypothetical protein EMIHUDRAFT_120156 [Emiliania huxleyi CCMP1516]EOD12269.1 hypothetical protein EMIHUDRAFT_120156 [Emiliania huxleyi CCMP1516]|eukprot:XP_005764698.1 hypothetical protein EMIHUDRAFT_120156 [Emiliania huxleyi CCMP1516]
MLLAKGSPPRLELGGLERVSYVGQTDREFTRELLAEAREEDEAAGRRRKRKPADAPAAEGGGGAEGGGSKGKRAKRPSEEGGGSREGGRERDQPLARRAGLPPADAATTERLKKLLTAVSKTLRGGRKVAELFLLLPTEEEAPGYYGLIKRPVSISSMKEYELDEAFATMVANAKRYNDEGSQVAADADVLGTAYADGRARLFADAAKLEPLPRGGGR